jgi:hypothetical protein
MLPCSATFAKIYCESVCLTLIVYISFLLKQFFVNAAVQGTNKYFPQREFFPMYVLIPNC